MVSVLYTTVPAIKALGGDHHFGAIMGPKYPIHCIILI